MNTKLQTEHNLEFLSLKEGCRGSSESTHVKMPHCWKSHALAHISLCMILRHAISLKELEHSLNVKKTPVLKWPGNLPEIISIENVWNITKKEIGNKLPCLKEDM